MGACILLVLHAAYVAAAAATLSVPVTVDKGLPPASVWLHMLAWPLPAPRLGARRLPVAAIFYCAVGAV